MSGCGRTFCPHCGSELIHRDHRHHYESSSALGQILHRDGPREIIFTDIDMCAVKLIGSRIHMKVLEHKQPQQLMRWGQATALKALDLCIRAAAESSLFGMAPGSGVFLVQGQLDPEEQGRCKVNFVGPQAVETLSGEPVLEIRRKRELWDWLCCGVPWTKKGRA